MVPSLLDQYKTNHRAFSTGFLTSPLTPSLIWPNVIFYSRLYTKPYLFGPSYTLKLLIFGP